jgi:tyrosine-specific transport protein
VSGHGRFLGGILLVAGTAIGAGMLALPVISGFAGFIPSVLALVVCWGFMFATAWLLLAVNLSLVSDKGAPKEINMITMASKTLGRAGRWVCWVSYLLLLYSLTAAYIAGSAPFFTLTMRAMSGLNLPDWTGLIPLLGLFGVFVYLGTKSVDAVNRLLMLGLIVTYAALIVFVPSHVDGSKLQLKNFPAIWLAIPVIITSFGFHIIIPTLTTYLHQNARKLKWTIFIGSLIPLLVYLIWEFLVLGVVPVTGSVSLSTAWEAGESAAAPLAEILQTPWIATTASAFSFFAIITSFLGVSLSLSDFLGDGLKMHRFTWGREAVCLLTFVPPLLFVLVYQRGFLIALQYAGIFVAILLGVLPALMAWKLPSYKTPLKRLFLLSILAFSVGIIGLDLLCSN